MAKVNRAARDRAARESRKAQNVVSGRYYTDYELGFHAYRRGDCNSLNWSPAMQAGWIKAAMQDVAFRKAIAAHKGAA